ncbi:MAG: hypothetical protein U9Q74_15715, partial [Gemmatimonadota bacterium]|nr:hypothetical protein [Gemmatimonadota bacterium]
RANVAAQASSQSERKAKKRDAEQAERAVHEAERAVEDLKRQLADTALYDGSSGGARRAGELQKQLAASERLLDAAMERWAATERG